MAFSTLLEAIRCDRAARSSLISKKILPSSQNYVASTNILQAGSILVCR